jgi:hypothetical protein
MSQDAISLLNVLEVQHEGRTRHFLAFVSAEDTGERGLPTRLLVGEFEPDDQGEFDPARFERNPEFIEALVSFMNETPQRQPEIIETARERPGEWLYVLDPRYRHEGPDDPAPSQVVGAFFVDETGAIRPDSFQYNPEHELFCPSTGVSGILMDRVFYEWMHRDPGAS